MLKKSIRESWYVRADFKSIVRTENKSNHGWFLLILLWIFTCRGGEQTPNYYTKVAKMFWSYKSLTLLKGPITTKLQASLLPSISSTGIICLWRCFVITFFDRTTLEHRPYLLMDLRWSTSLFPIAKMFLNVMSGFTYAKARNRCFNALVLCKKAFLHYWDMVKYRAFMIISKNYKLCGMLSSWCIITTFGYLELLNHTPCI